MKWLVVVAAAARQPTQPPPALGSGSPAPTIMTAIVGCAAAGPRPRAGAIDAPIPSGWFPYARRGETPGDIASPLASKANLGLTEKLADLDLCLTGKTGSLSIMLEVATTGVVSARVGGIGDRASEQCVAKLATRLELPPPAQLAELECVLSVNATGPFRVTADGGGYRVVELTGDAVTLDGKPVDLMTLAPALDTTLVIAPPDEPAARLVRVLAWVGNAPAVLFAVRADGGPPVLVATSARPAEDRLAVYVEDQQLHACVKQHRGAASLLEPRRVDEMMREAVAACGDACPEVVEIGIGGNHLAKQLVGAASAIRRAGHDPILTFGTRSSCKR